MARKFSCHGKCCLLVFFWEIYGIQSVIIVFIKPFSWALQRSRQVQPKSSNPTPLRSIVILASHWCLGIGLHPSGLLIKKLYTILFPPYTLPTTHLIFLNSEICHNNWHKLQIMNIRIMPFSPLLIRHISEIQAILLNGLSSLNKWIFNSELNSKSRRDNSFLTYENLISTLCLSNLTVVRGSANEHSYWKSHCRTGEDVYATRNETL
jgi:hypothetical protein